MSTAGEILGELEGILASCLVRDRLWAVPRLRRIHERLAAGQAVDRLVAEVRVRLNASVEAVTKRSETPLRIAFPEALPVSAAKAEVQEALRTRRSLVLVGETGSGKTTQLPKMLLEMGYGRQGFVAMTQPRRLAAVAMAERIREELSAPGDAVVHSVRFDDRSSDDTLVKVMTDGLLLAEMSRDPDLSRYEAIIVDEAHERSQNIDLLLALLRLLRRRRLDLVVAVSSASIAAEAFAAHLGDEGQPAPIVRVGGRTFPVEIRWKPPADDDLGYHAAALAAIRDLHASEGPGDILVFLPTERDILEAMRRLRDLDGATVLPCFGRLSAGEQKRIFQTVPGRKVVLATNIAETSLTIPGIVFVVDAGMARIKRFHLGARTERLPVEAVAQASCIQRAGRAGRIQPGVCVRLYAEDDYARRPPFADPEILRSNLAAVLLHALNLGLHDPETLPWLDAPSPNAWRAAWGMLEELGGVDLETRRLTPLGRQMAALPVDPAVARILLAGLAEGVPHEACTVAAFLSVQDPRVRPLGEEAKADAAHRAFRHEAGDLTTILTLWDQIQALPSQSARARFANGNFLGVRRLREWADVRHQLWGVMREQGRTSVPAEGHPPGAWPIDAVHRSVLAGMIGNILCRDAEARCYRAAGGREAHVHPGSSLRAGKADDGKRAPPAPPWILSCELVETTRLFARLCAPIDPDWVVRLAGDRVKRDHRDIRYDERRQQVVAIERVTWKGLTLVEGRTVAYERVDASAATRCFAAALAGDAGLSIARHVEVLRQDQDLLRRLRSLRHRLRRNDLDVDEDAVAAHYAGRLLAAPYPVASTAALRRFLKEGGDQALALDAAAFPAVDLLVEADRLAPEVLACGDLRLPVRYRYSPGDEDDGAQLAIRDRDLGRLDLGVIEDGIRAWWPQAVEAFLRALPKDQRRHLQPLAQHAREIAAEIAGDGDGGLVDRVHAALERRLGPCDRPNPAILDPWLAYHLVLTGADGKILYRGRDRSVLRGQIQGRDPLARLRARHGSAPAVVWPDGAAGLPRRIAEGGLVGFLGLARARLADGRVGARLEVYAGEESARVWHGEGIRALTEAALEGDLLRLVEAPPPRDAAVIERNLGQGLGALRRAFALEAAGEGFGVPADAQAFATALAGARQRLPKVADLDRLFAATAQTAAQLRHRLKQGSRGLGEAAAARQVAVDLDRLLQPGWPQRLPWSALRRIDAFLDGLWQRLQRGSSDAASAQRLAQRAADLVADAGQVLGDDPRLIQLVGEGDAARQLAADCEDCLLALAIPGASAALGFAEKRLRDGCARIDAVLRAARRRIQDTRAVLRDCHDVVRSIRDPQQREPLQREVEEALQRHPDLSLGADLLAQDAAARALLQRLKYAAA